MLCRINKLKQKNNHLLEQQMNNLQESKNETDTHNQRLEEMVRERTQHLHDANQKLRDAAFFNSHITRRPLANILGLISIYNKENVADEFNTIVLENLLISAQELDAVIHQINEITDKDIQI